MEMIKLNILNLIDFLDENFTRTVKSTKNDIEVTTWENTNNHSIVITVDETPTTYTDLIQLCIKPIDTIVYLYVNHTRRRNLTKIQTTTISTITIAE